MSTQVRCTNLLVLMNGAYSLYITMKDAYNLYITMKDAYSWYISVSYTHLTLPTKLSV